MKTAENPKQPNNSFKISAKRGSVTQAVTDVILCSKIKTAPEGMLDPNTPLSDCYNRNHFLLLLQ